MWLFSVEMPTSNKQINSWKTKPYIKISILKKQFFLNWWVKVMDFFKGVFFIEFSQIYSGERTQILFL